MEQTKKEKRAIKKEKRAIKMADRKVVRTQTTLRFKNNIKIPKQCKYCWKLWYIHHDCKKPLKIP